MVCEDKTCTDKTCKIIHDKREFWGILWLEPNRRTTYSTSSSCFDRVVRATLKQMQDNGDIEEAAWAAEAQRNKLMLSMEKMKMSRKGTCESLGPLEVDSEERLQELRNYKADMKVDGLWEFEGERSDANEEYDPNGDEEEEYESG